MTAESAAGSPDAAAPLELALEQSHDVMAKVEECADDIGNANVLLKATLVDGTPAPVRALSAREALAAGVDVETKVQECADDLHVVTETLAQGIEDLRQTEAALARSKKALAETRVALAISRDAEQEARLQALHDSTTGLPNRELFETRLEQAIALARRHDGTLAVMFLDLDRFKAVNDIHGHAAGDAVLLEVARRLSAHARAEDTVCRNGGDEFLYLLVNPEGRANVGQIAGSVSARIEQPIAWLDASLKVRASIGIAVYPGDGANGEDLIRSADAAMYQAKKRGSGAAFAADLEAPAAA